MGILTLAEFRDDLDAAMGRENVGSPFLDRQINRAYLDLAGSVDFEVLDLDAEDSTVVDQVHLDLPEGEIIAIKVVKNVTEDIPLGYLNKSEFFRRPSVPTGTPTHWTRHSNKILLNPTPAEVTSLFIAYKVNPAPLAEEEDNTILPSMWDIAVFLLSVHYALLARGQEQRAAAWQARAGMYIQTRMTESDLQSLEPGVGASLPLSMKKMLELQGGAS